jgi:hypothetical protein
MATQQRDKNFSGSGSSMAESAKETAGRAGEAVKDAASGMGQKASDAGSYIAHKAEDATSAVGGSMKSLADTIRDKGPHEGMLGNCSSAVARTLESSGRELQEHGLSGIADDITATVRRHPIPAVLIGVGLGVLLARVLTK